MTLSTANVFAADYSSSQNYDALSALNSAVLLNTGNGSTITIYEWDSDTEAADAEEFGKSVKMEQVYSSSGTKAVTYVSSWPGKAYSGDTTVEFSIKRTDSDNNFYFWIRDTSNIPVLCFGSGKVTLLGTQICTYDKNVWYDVKLGVDFDNKYANIKI